MADLVTHLCSALLPGAFLRSAWVPLIGVGTVLPDALGRAVPLALERIQLAGAPLPDEVIWSWGALHGPSGMLLVGPLIALAFVRGQRGPALQALWLGVVLHLSLDVLQFHHGQGYPLLAPLSWATFELGWIGSEATVPLALPLLGITAAAWLPRGLQRWAGRDRARRWVVASGLLHGLLPAGALLWIAAPRLGGAVAIVYVAYLVLRASAWCADHELGSSTDQG
ncbi:MAG TPA: hypothetical protein ENK18_09635 [Deltaproteobacteria bacterium]|nr:hypothetical protein [Deltaproteobacteria bacterium]